MVLSMTFCGLRVFQSQFIVLPTWVLLDWSRSATHVETMFFKDETAFVGCLFCSHVGDAFKLLSNAGEYALQSLDWPDGSLSAVHPATLIDKQQQVQKQA